MKQLLSPKEVGQAIGVSESSLKRWIDEGAIPAARTAGGHRRIAIADAVHFIRTSNLPVIRPEVFGLSEVAAARGRLGTQIDIHQPLLEALKQGDGPRVRGLVLSRYLAGDSLADLCDGPIATAMHTLGELWRHEATGIFIEHRASDLCVQVMHQLRTLQPPTGDKAVVAIGGSPAGDPYTLPSLMAATVLASEGWHEMNLGAQTPLDTLALAARESKATLVWLSISVATDPPESLVKPIQQLAAQLARQQISLVVGGRALPPTLRPTPKSNLHLAASMAELAAFARGLRTATKSRR